MHLCVSHPAGCTVAIWATDEHGSRGHFPWLAYDPRDRLTLIERGWDPDEFLVTGWYNGGYGEGGVIARPSP